MGHILVDDAAGDHQLREIEVAKVRRWRQGLHTPKRIGSITISNIGMDDAVL